MRGREGVQKARKRAERWSEAGRLERRGVAIVIAIRIVSDQLYLPEVLFDVEEDGEAVEIGLKDLMWFLFFGMPGDKERVVCDEVRERRERRKVRRRGEGICLFV